MSENNEDMTPAEREQRAKKKRKVKHASRNLYTEADHRAAFLKWYETRNFRRTADDIIPGQPSNVLVIKNWARKDHHCKWGCPWHGWAELAEEREAQVRAGIIPIDGDMASHEKVVEIRKQTRDEALRDLLKSDLERMMHWEIIWNKVIYHATGLVLPCAFLEGEDGVLVADQDALKEYYKRGLKPNNLDSAIRSLSAVQQEINKLREYLGIYKTPGQVEHDSSPSVELTLQDLQHMRELIENTTPEKREILAKLMQNETRALKALGNE